VHIAARLLGSAAPGRVVVTSTIRDLVTGTDLSFAPLGPTILRGVPGSWELFEVGSTDR
jgi:class 3 adenylate cyclase